MLVQHFELLTLGQSEHYVFWLQISVDYSTNSVHVVQAKQNLLGDVPDDRDGNSSIVVLLDQRQQILAENLECHNEVFSVLRVVKKLVEHLEVVSVVSCCLQSLVLKVLSQKLFPLWVFEIGCYLEKNVLLLKRRLSVLWRAFLNLEGVELLIA
jgi:hypothetical protein